MQLSGRDRIQVRREGEIFVFDDIYEHEVWNDTGEERVILLFDLCACPPGCSTSHSSSP